MDGNRIDAHVRHARLVIVGAGFSGTALALALLRDPPAATCTIVLVERSGRFGPGLAYAGHWPQALLNVPAGRMSVDERRPREFCNYLAQRGLPAHEGVFAPRAVYGDYLGARLREAAATAPARVRLQQVSGTVVDAIEDRAEHSWHLRLADGDSIAADAVVLALGHQAPAGPPALRALAKSGVYVANPWQHEVDAAAAAGTAPPARVLLVGTGLTMADTACALLASPQPPREIVAVSRRGLLSQPRPPCAWPPPAAASQRASAPDASTNAAMASALDLRELRRETTTRGLVAALRRHIAAAEAGGTGWRAVIAAVRDLVPDLWHRLDEIERRRFLRHVRPYWDVHRHQLPPAVGQQVLRHVAEGVLCVRAARIVTARIQGDRALVTLRDRGRSTMVEEAFDRVVNCSGPDDDLARSPEPLVEALLRSGLLTPCPTGIGVKLDAAGRPLGRADEPAPGLYYLGPWARARDLEATAVQELRAQAHALATLLRSRLTDRAAMALSRAPARVAAQARGRARPAPGSSA